MDNSTKPQSASLRHVFFAMTVVAAGVAWECPARADRPPIITIIDGGGTNVDADPLRRDLSMELGVPVISIFEAGSGPVPGILAAAVLSYGRRAAIRYVPAEGTRYAMMLGTATRGPGDPTGRWLVAPCAAAVRTSDMRRLTPNPGPDVIDPWVAAQLVPTGDSANAGDNPWSHAPRRSVPRVRVTHPLVAE